MQELSLPNTQEVLAVPVHITPYSPTPLLISRVPRCLNLRNMNRQRRQ